MLARLKHMAVGFGTQDVIDQLCEEQLPPRASGQSIAVFSDPAIQAVLNPQTLSLVMLGAFLGGMASGAAGFAYGVVATSIWLHAISPIHTVLLVTAGGLTIQSGMVWSMRRSVDMGRLLPFLIPGLLGIPLGVVLVVRTEQEMVRSALALFLLVYGLYALFAPKLPHFSWGGRTADAAIGFTGGVIGGMSGLSGILPAIWTQIRGWPKDIARGVYQPFILIAQSATLAVVGLVALDRVAVLLFLFVLPALFAGAYVGWKIYGLLDERQFQQMFAILLVLSGTLLIF